ncbi:hypothetical protein [Pedobacter sp. Hv1]|uniref:hypothetical protein n=1 Tax=Pedobacter sp. Hv1 TaxID=1740090 RepID=UPI0006D8D530|nr:hypothetical protein [Pedobacter sp. Hv1]KQC02795.1 hypothetical protein AQF98_04265 [Pedobacter sp. Hv1]
MTTLEQSIEKYNSELNDDLKAMLIASEFEDIEDDKKWIFLLQLIQQRDTYDLVKINVYKMIELADFSSFGLEKVKNEVLVALNDEEDELVRQWGFISLMNNFSHFHDVLDLCMHTVENITEDLDLRHCAYGVIKKSKDMEKIKSFYERLLQVEEFKKYAERFYAEINK